jgi:hypothetical protein
VCAEVDAIAEDCEDGVCDGRAPADDEDHDHGEHHDEDDASSGVLQSVFTCDASGSWGSLGGHAALGAALSLARRRSGGRTA